MKNHLSDQRRTSTDRLGDLATQKTKGKRERSRTKLKCSVIYIFGRDYIVEIDHSIYKHYYSAFNYTLQMTKSEFRANALTLTISFITAKVILY